MLLQNCQTSFVHKKKKTPNNKKPCAPFSKLLVLLWTNCAFLSSHIHKTKLHSSSETDTALPVCRTSSMMRDASSNDPLLLTSCVNLSQFLVEGFSSRWGTSLCLCNASGYMWGNATIASGDLLCTGSGLQRARQLSVPSVRQITSKLWWLFWPHLYWI